MCLTHVWLLTLKNVNLWSNRDTHSYPIVLTHEPRTLKKLVYLYSDLQLLITVLCSVGLRLHASDSDPLLTNMEGVSACANYSVLLRLWFLGHQRSNSIRKRGEEAPASSHSH